MRSKLLEYATGGFTFSVPLVLFKCHKELAKPNYYQLSRVLLQLTSMIYCIFFRGALVQGPFLWRGASCTPAVGGSSPQLFSLTIWWKPKTSPGTQNSVLLKRQQNKIWIIRIFHSQGLQDFPGKEKQFLKHPFT